jgi:hypothetical protein
MSDYERGFELDTRFITVTVSLNYILQISLYLQHTQYLLSLH